MADNRFRNWEFVIFPVGKSFESDEHPFNWYSWLVDRAVPFCAIVHQPEQDETKEHVHVIVSYDGKKTREQAVSDFSHPNIPTAGDRCFVTVRSILGAETYLTHMDYPDKTQYQVSDIVCGCGYKLHIDDDGVMKNHLKLIMEQVYLHRSLWDFNDVLSWVLNEHPDALGALRQSAYMVSLVLKR